MKTLRPIPTRDEFKKNYAPLPDYAELKRQGVIHRGATFKSDDNQYIRKPEPADLIAADIRYSTVPDVPGLSLIGKGMLVMLLEQHENFVITSDYIKKQFLKEGVEVSKTQVSRALRELEEKKLLLCLPAIRNGHKKMSGKQYVLYAKVTDPEIIKLARKDTSKLLRKRDSTNPPKTRPRKDRVQYQTHDNKKKKTSFSHEEDTTTDPEAGIRDSEEWDESDVDLSPLPPMTPEEEVDLGNLCMALIPPRFAPVPGIETWIPGQGPAELDLDRLRSMIKTNGFNCPLK